MEPKLTSGISLTGFQLAMGRSWCWILVPELSPLETIFRDIERAIDAQLYYAAIALALSVPDICALLEDEPGKAWSTEKKYVAWCEKNLDGRFHYLTALDIWRLRGGVLHQGSFFGHPKSRFNAVLFTLPNPQNNTFHENHFEGGGKRAFNLDTVTFCSEIIDAARKWYEARKDDPSVSANINNLVRYRPNGLSPYMVGMPLIA